MNKKDRNRKKKKIHIFLGVILFILVFIVIFLTQKNNEPNDDSEMNVSVNDIAPVSINLGYDLEITDIGNYTGLYIEDGKDEVLSDILMIVITNKGSLPLQYAEISLPVGDKTAYFKLSTLPQGESIVVLEQNRMKYDKGAVYTVATAENVVFFQEDLDLCEDKIKIQSLNGAMNVSNISGNDITEDVTIYYKNNSIDMLYGGITYRVCIKGGIKEGEIKQVVADHFNDNNSRIMFVTIGQ